jgi:hypothetical protein
MKIGIFKILRIQPDNVIQKNFVTSGGTGGTTIRMADFPF